MCVYRGVLVYSDLKSLTPFLDERPPDHEIELHVTGHMQRYMWSFDARSIPMRRNQSASAMASAFA